MHVRDREPTRVRVDLIEQGRHAPQRRVGQGLGPPEQVSLGTKPSGARLSIIAACRSPSPRIADLLQLTVQHLVHDCLRSFFSSLQGH